MPEPLLYTEKNKVPEATIEALKMRKDKANIYVLGPEKIVSKEVEKELSKYGKVTRISGETPTENSIAFAKFKDEKQNLAGDSQNLVTVYHLFQVKHQI